MNKEELAEKLMQSESLAASLELIDIYDQIQKEQINRKKLLVSKEIESFLTKREVSLHATNFVLNKIMSI